MTVGWNGGFAPWSARTVVDVMRQTYVFGSRMDSRLRGNDAVGFSVF